MVTARAGQEHFQARSLAEDPEFGTEASRIFGEDKRADEALFGVKTALSYSPTTVATSIVTQGPPVLYALKTIKTRHWPGVVIFYTVNTTHVILHRIIETK
jgi:hypothetical protein